MTITRLFLFNRVHDETSARPGNRDLFVQEVINVLYQEKSVFFQNHGQLLSPNFKSNSAVVKLAKEFHTKVKKRWDECHQTVGDLRKNPWFNNFVDFSKVDFSTLLSEIPQQPIEEIQMEEVQVEEVQVDVDFQDEAMEEEVLFEDNVDVVQAAVAPMAPTSPPKPPKMSKPLKDYCPKQQTTIGNVQLQRHLQAIF